jgi:hypothetical protein
MSYLIDVRGNLTVQYVKKELPDELVLLAAANDVELVSTKPDAISEFRERLHNSDNISGMFTVDDNGCLYVESAVYGFDDSIIRELCDIASNSHVRLDGRFIAFGENPLDVVKYTIHDNESESSRLSTMVFTDGSTIDVDAV